MVDALALEDLHHRFHDLHPRHADRPSGTCGWALRGILGRVTITSVMRKLSTVSRNNRVHPAARQGVRTGSVQSVERALELFGAVVRADGAVGISELSST